MLAFIMSAGLAYAQVDVASIDNTSSAESRYSAPAEDLAEDLQSRIDLSDEQAEEVKGILVAYFEEVEPYQKTGNIEVSRQEAMAGTLEPVSQYADTTDKWGTNQDTTDNAYGNTHSDSSDNASGNDSYGTDTSTSGDGMYGTDTNEVNDGSGMYGTDTTDINDGADYNSPSNGSVSMNTGVGDNPAANDSQLYSTDKIEKLGNAFEARQRADNKITAALEGEQKQEYKSEKADWWSDVQQKFNQS
jgi:hypothetical protein